MARTIKTNRVGEFYHDTKRNDTVTIVEYYGCDNVIVEFKNTGTRVKVEYSQFKKENIKDPMYKDSLGVGCIGIGKHSATTKNPVYRRWFAMLQRCYDTSNRAYTPNKSVCEEWLIFQNFADWLEEHWYEVDGQIMCLDKDILVSGNNTYSPQTCCVVPMEINNAFNHANKRLSFRRDKHGRYTVSGNSQYLGYVNNKEDAWKLYKTYKEEYIYELAQKYKNVLEERVYNTLINYKVPEELNPNNIQNK